MQRLVKLALFLFGMVAVSVFSEEKKPRPAWNSTLKCLAPLAREARSGASPLTMKQAFFDGPFDLDSKEGTMEANPLDLGFRKLIEFDDYEAERHFREALQFPRWSSAALLGLAQVNSDDARRASCFLDEALGQIEADNSDLRAWHQFLSDSLALSSTKGRGVLLESWKKAALASENSYLALSLARHILISASGGQAIQDEKVVLHELAEKVPLLKSLPLLSDREEKTPTAPQWLRLQAEQLLLSGDMEPALQSLVASIDAEFRRLDKTGLLMPQASLNLGDSAERLLRILEVNHPEKAAELAENLMRLPRDPFSVGKRWRRLHREKTPWVVGRTALARIAMKRGQWATLADLPRGFSSRDKSEWFLWQIVAATEMGSDTNLWLAALRREREGKDLLAGAENYLHWKQEGEWLEEIPLPAVPCGKKNPSEQVVAEASTPVNLPGSLIAPVKKAAPEFSLPDWRNQPIQLKDYEEGPLLVIFFLGGGCLHCVEQLTAFGPWASQYEEAGIPILAVSTDPVEVLTETISGETAPGSSFPIPIVSDEGLSVFQEWGVYDAFDGRAIHATFLLNSEKDIIWMEKGNAPYMHPDFLLEESKRLLLH